MSVFCFGFMVGAAIHWLLQWLLMIPFSRRHRLVMALLNRAKMYQERAKLLEKSGKYQEALNVIDEVRMLMKQVEELRK